MIPTKWMRSIRVAVTADTVLLLWFLLLGATAARSAGVQHPDPPVSAAELRTPEARSGPADSCTTESAPAAAHSAAPHPENAAAAGRHVHTRRKLPAARQPVGIAYYDADRLYDTIPSLFYDDRDYTPDGRLRWTSQRYRRKIGNTAALIDSMALPLIVLWGVENETVVRDISAACHGDYTYLHRTLDSHDGLDFALLYYGDRFYPEYVEPGRRHLYVEGELDGTVVGLLLCADPRTTRWLAERLRRERPHTRLAVLGRTSAEPLDDLGLLDALARAERAGRGTVRRRGGWEMRDRIVLDTAFRLRGGDVFMRRYLVDRKSGNPLPTFSRNGYSGGYGSSLPLYAYFE